MQTADLQSELCPALSGPPILSGVRVPVGMAPHFYVVPLYPLSPSACLPPSSPLRLPGARPNASSIKLTPDVHGIVGGKLPGHSILALQMNI